ncbi:MAG TPA: lamin tail domain-containing protein [Kofleriaceae bacterium]|nr:lamin tail domain-containing protein [Kofleriaceae bacterium]
MQARALIIAAISGLLAAASGGCSSLLGLEDPSPDFGDDSGPRTLLSIAIKPDPLDIPLGVTVKLTAIGTFDDGSESDVTAETEFTAESGGAIEVTDGFAKALSPGEAMVNAMIGRISGNTRARVLPAAPDHLVFTLNSFKLKQLQSVRLRATAVLTDGTMTDATAGTAFVSDTPAVATPSTTTPGQIDAGTQAGMATITASLPGARSASVTINVSTKPCFPMINEFQVAGQTAGDEWVEILNPCTMAFTVTGWTLAYRGAGTVTGGDSNALVNLTGQLQPGDIKLFAGPDYGGANDGTMLNGLGATGGAIALRMGALSTGMIADSLTYGGAAVTPGHPFTEGTSPLPAIAASQSAARLPYDGHDEDAGSADFMLLTTTRTPRTRNVP